MGSLDKKIGVLGGGQLGKMLFEAGSPLNLNYVFLEKSEESPAALICKNQVVGSLQDQKKINELSAKADVLTYEIEHVNTNALLALEAEGKEVIPSPRILGIIQDKGLQKNFYSDNGIETLPFEISTAEELDHKVSTWSDEKFVLKHRKGGYDGKGVQLLSKNKFAGFKAAKDSSLESEHGYVIEQILEDVIEVSVIVSVGNNEIEIYPTCEMVFDPKSNLMDYLISPSSLSADLDAKCKTIARKAVESFKSKGLFAVELFVKGSQVYVNEIAPRPHNSGHHTIESTYTSQYEQLNRILLGLPLGSTEMISPAATCNIVGNGTDSGRYKLSGLDQALKIEGVYVHMYGKKTTSPYRKLGHFTVLGDTREEVVDKMDKAKNLLQVKTL